MIPSDTRGEGVTTSAHVGSDEVRVWQSDRYTCVYARSTGAEATVALQRHDAWRIAMAMVPEIERCRTDCSDALKALHELKIEHREPAIQTLREVAGEVDCDSGCDHSSYDGSCNATTCEKYERGEFCGWMAAATLLDLAQGLENHKRLTAPQEALAPPPAGGEVADHAKRLVNDLCLEVRGVEALMHSGRRFEKEDLEEPLNKRAAARSALLAAFASLTTEIAALKREVAAARATALKEAAQIATDQANEDRGLLREGLIDHEPAGAAILTSVNIAKSIRHLASTDSTETGEAERG